MSTFDADRSRCGALLEFDTLNIGMADRAIPSHTQIPSSSRRRRRGPAHAQKLSSSAATVLPLCGAFVLQILQLLAALLLFGAPVALLSSSHGSRAAGWRWSAPHLVTVAEAAPAAALPTFTFGYLRGATAALDSPSVLAGLFATVRYYNDNDVVPGVRFALNVTTVPCTSASACRTPGASSRAAIQNFKASMGGYSAILRPNAFFAADIVDEAKRLGDIPVINPDDVRRAAYTDEMSHVINFRQDWGAQAEHLFTYMMQNSRCARSAIIHGRVALAEEYRPAQVASIQEMFARGEYERPPALESQSASDAVFYDFFFSDMPRRRCFIVLGTASMMQETMERLMLNSTFNINSFYFYGVSQMMSDSFISNASSVLYRNVYLTHWLPPVPDPSVSPFEEAMVTWSQLYAAIDKATLHRRETFPPIENATRTAYESWVIASYLMETVRSAIGHARGAAAMDTTPGAVRPLQLSSLVDALYRDARTIDGHSFNKLVRTCPAPPAPQLCFCNTVSAESYMFRVNSATGTPDRLFDNRETGQRDVAYVRFPTQCGYEISSWSYPITALALYPNYLLGDGGAREDEELHSYNLFQSVFGIMTRETNYEPTPPTRALRYAAYDVADDRDGFNSQLFHYIDTLRPFIIYGSLQTSVQSSQGILTLLPTFLGMQLEDPVLTDHSAWRWSALQLRPTLGDYVHSLVGYYAENARRFTSVGALAATAAEAALISKSFATFGYDIPVSAITVSDDPTEWRRIVSAALSDAASFRPFFLVATQRNTGALIETATITAGQLSRGTLAIACSISVTYTAKLLTNFSDPIGNGDIIFGAFNREWWLPAAYEGVPMELQQYVVEPRYHIALLAIQVSRQLYSQVYFDYKTTAAEILYRSSVISAAGTSLGPFSNTTCTAREISRNERDRTCQCTKGIRTIFIHSMKDYLEGVPSDRTSRYSYTMTTCGVMYTAYVPPPSAALVGGGAALDAGAIAGISVGACLLFLVVAGYIVYTACFAP